MKDEFGFQEIRSVEFCVSLRNADGTHINYLVPTDRSVQDTLKDVLDSTLNEIEPSDGDWSPYELSEKYGSKESLRADLASAEMAGIRALYGEEGWEVNARALADPARLVYYFAVFRDAQARKLIGVRQATQFKGTIKGHFLSFIDDTLKMIADRVFKLDNQFDFLITAQRVYVLHPAGFDRIAGIEEFASARAKQITLGLGSSVKFLDFTGLAEFVARHKRAARLVAALHKRDDLKAISRALFCETAKNTGVILVRTGKKVCPAKGSEVGCLELLDHRRYVTTLRRGAKPAFVASSRRPV